MPDSLPLPVTEYLSRLQDDRSFSGLEDFHRRNGHMHRRTMYRWHRRYAGLLIAFPSFAVEALGLAHVHLFIVEPARTWSRFPYAVEHTWLTPDFSRRVLYLHCIVP